MVWCSALWLVWYIMRCRVMLCSYYQCMSCVVRCPCFRCVVWSIHHYIAQSILCLLVSIPLSLCSLTPVSLYTLSFPASSHHIVLLACGLCEHGQRQRWSRDCECKHKPWGLDYKSISPTIFSQIIMCQTKPWCSPLWQALV